MERPILDRFMKIAGSTLYEYRKELEKYIDSLEQENKELKAEINDYRSKTELIIETLQRKEKSFLGTRGEEVRQAFKNGLKWSIDTIETLTKTN